MNNGIVHIFALSKHVANYTLSEAHGQWRTQDFIFGSINFKL